MKKEEFENIGTDIDFIPFGNNPEDEISGKAFSWKEIERIKNSLFSDKKKYSEEEIKEIVEQLEKDLGITEISEYAILKLFKKRLFGDDEE